MTRLELLATVTQFSYQSKSWSSTW